MTGWNGMSRRYSRRAFLGGLAGLTGLLAACGGGSSKSGGTGSKSTSVGSLQPAATTAVTVAGTRYAHETMLADAAMLRGATSGVKIVALTPQADFAKGHVDGATQIDWPDLALNDSSSDAAIQRWQKQVEQKLGALGITPSDHVVAYDGGTLFATRLWWVLAVFKPTESAGPQWWSVCLAERRWSGIDQPPERRCGNLFRHGHALSASRAA